MSSSKDYDYIIRLAQKESARSGHFYVGVEHLFIALTRLDGGVTTSTLEEQNVAPRFVRYMIRQEVGQGDNRRFWPGFRDTPRLQTVVQLARQLARARGTEALIERDLLLAILREGESLPYRVLTTINVDLDRLEVSAANWSGETRSRQIRVLIEAAEGIDLTKDERIVLQQMFREYDRVVIQQQLDQGYTSAKVLVAEPSRAGGWAVAPVVVKLDDRQSILYEKRRYDSFVHETLPPATARIVDNPVVPDQSKYGGLKYTFIRDTNAQKPVDLADFTRANGPEALSKLLLGSLYPVFGETWWSQGDPYQFGVWQEYEMVLPPALVLEVGDDLPAPRRRLSPLGQWSRRGRFAPREVVAVEGFTVEDFYLDRGAIQLVAGSGPEAQNRSGKLEVRGLDETYIKSLYRGGVVDRLVGQVLYTRDDLLYQQITALEPDFDVVIDRLPGQSGFPAQLPNPLFRYGNLLHRHIAGTLSPIHGDLHLHNILVGPGGNAWLIDFAQTREGHTLFDWAVLEVNLLTTVVAPVIETDEWRDLWLVIAQLADIGQNGLAPAGSGAVDRALHPIAAVRNIVYDCLADKDDWREYYVALSLCALRGLRWERTLSLRARRLLFLVSALAMSATAAKDGTITATGGEVDRTEFNLDATDIISHQQLGTLSSPAVDRQEQGWGMLSPTDALGQAPMQFAAYYTSDVNPGAWSSLQAYVFTKPAEGDVFDDARLQAGHTPDDGWSTAGTGRSRSGEDGAQITAVPSLPGFQFDPVSDTNRFHDGWQRFDFQMRATGVAPYEEQQGHITFYLEGIVVADVPFGVTVDPGGDGQRTSSGPLNPYRAIYCSYSPTDNNVVQRVERVAKILGSDFMQEVVRLRGGNNQSDDLLAMIEMADVFQLFWSEQSAMMPLVTREWQRALQRDKEKFIRPVYWDNAIPTPAEPLMRIPFEFVPELGH